MMTVNGTLFVQMINFGVAYYMLKWFLFRPLVQIIMHEKEVVDQLVKSIDQKKELFKDKERERIDYWVECYDYLHKKQPHYNASERSFFMGVTLPEWEIVDTVSSQSVVEGAAHSLVTILLDTACSESETRA